MSKFKVISGENITSIAARDREIKVLELEIEKRENPRDKDLVVYAYHFVRLGNLLLAQKYLNRLDSSYFESGIYKDLFQAMLTWSMIQASPNLKNAQADAIYEYFIVVKRAREMFAEVNFTTKPVFLRFCADFKKFSELAVERCPEV